MSGEGGDIDNTARDACRIAGIGYWRRDLETGERTWSDVMYALHGISRTPGERAPPPDRAVSFYPAEDLQRCEALLEAVRLSGRPAALKVRLRRADDGRDRIVEFSAEAVPGPDGQPVALHGVMRDLTEEETLKQRLIESEAQYRALAEASPDAIVRYGADYVVQYASPAVSRYGWRPEDFVGRHASEFVPAEDWQAIVARTSPGIKSGRMDLNIDRSHRLLTAHGEPVWVESYPGVLRDEAGETVAVVSHVRDITERRAAGAALAESERRYRAICEKVTDIVLRLDAKGRVAFVSPAVAEVLGRDPAEVLGCCATSLVHRDDVAAVRAAYRRVMRSGHLASGPIRFRAAHMDGRWVWLECNPTPVLAEDGALAEFFDVAREVSARVEIEAEQRRAREAAESAAAAKAEFMANMSHEIRTPLTSIIGFSSLLAARADLGDEARRHVGRVRAAGQGLLALVNDILDFSKLEAGEMRIVPEPIDAALLFEETLDLFQPLAEPKGLKLMLRGDARLPGRVVLDPERLRQILLNLLGNAVKFTEAGEVVLAYAYDGELQRLQVEVSDTGPGVAPDQQAKLFQRFTQVDGGSSRRHGGAGLGLAICRALAEAMGGGIAMRSALGQGSTFSFWLPAPEGSESACERLLEA